MRLLAVTAVLLVAGPAFAESPAGGGARQIRISLDGAERATVGADGGARRFIRLTLEGPKNVATFPPLGAFAAREELDARDGEPRTTLPLRLALLEGAASREKIRGRSIRTDLDGERIALSTPLPARRIRTTLD